MSTKTWSAREVHEELAMMAWERILEPSPLPTEQLLKRHLKEMYEILGDPEQYAELWRRIRAKDRPRCEKCRGTGFIGKHVGVASLSKIYCDCALGRELQRTDQRIADEQEWKLAQPHAEPTEETTTSKLRRLSETIHAEFPEES